MSSEDDYAAKVADVNEAGRKTRVALEEAQVELDITVSRLRTRLKKRHGMNDQEIGRELASMIEQAGQRLRSDIDTAERLRREKRREETIATERVNENQPRRTTSP